MYEHGKQVFGSGWKNELGWTVYKRNS
jgi:hypothetical protein